MQRESTSHVTAQRSHHRPEKCLWAKPYQLEVNLLKRSHWFKGLFPGVLGGLSCLRVCAAVHWYCVCLRRGTRSMLWGWLFFVSAPSPFKAPSQSKVPVRTLLQFKQTYLYFHKISQLTASNLLALISSDMLVSFPNHQCKIKIIYMHVVLL